MQTDVLVPTLQLLRGLTAHAEHYNQYAGRTKRFSQSLSFMQLISPITLSLSNSYSLWFGYISI